jgi:hypothetical protein
MVPERSSTNWMHQEGRNAGNEVVAGVDWESFIEDGAAHRSGRRHMQSNLQEKNPKPPIINVVCPTGVGAGKRQLLGEAPGLQV